MPIVKITKPSGKSYRFNKFPVSIGRSRRCSLPISGQGVSRKHALITLNARSGYYEVDDLDSLNGIKVNGIKVTHAVLQSGDEVDVGDVKLVFQHQSPNDPADLKAKLKSNRSTRERLAQVDRSAGPDELDAEALNFYAESDASSAESEADHEPEDVEAVDPEPKRKVGIATLGLLSCVALILLFLIIFLSYELIFKPDETEPDALQAPLQTPLQMESTDNRVETVVAEEDWSFSSDTGILLDQSTSSADESFSEGDAGYMGEETFSEQPDTAASVSQQTAAPQLPQSQEIYDTEILSDIYVLSGSVEASYQSATGPLQPTIKDAFIRLPSKNSAVITSRVSGADAAAVRARLPRFQAIDQAPSSDLDVETDYSAENPNQSPDQVPQQSEPSSSALGSPDLSVGYEAVPAEDVPVYEGSEVQRRGLNTSGQSTSKSTEEWESEAQRLIDRAVREYREGYARRAVQNLKRMMVNGRFLSNGTRQALKERVELIDPLIVKYYIGDKALKEGRKRAAFEAWEEFILFERERIGDNKTYYSKQINKTVLAEYFTQAKAAEKSENYPLVHRLMSKAAKIDQSGRAERKIAEIDGMAKNAYELGLANEQSNIQLAIESWQKVVELVPADHELFTKSMGKITWHQSQSLIP